MGQENTEFKYGLDILTCSKVIKLCRGQLKGVFTSECLHNINKSREVVNELAKGTQAVYGINTGFGPLCSTRITPDETALLQHNLLKSHSVGIGDAIPQNIAKSMMILKLHALAQGFSGVSIEVLQRISWLVQQNIIPVVPSQGSVGASGDLAPLAHLFLPLIGLGQVSYKGDIVPTEKMMEVEKILPIHLGAKEGLGLINGTQFIAAYAIQIIDRLHNCLSHADIIGAMMIEGLLGSASPFTARLHELRPFPGNQHVAYRISELLKGSAINESHATCDRVQDPYSLRCIPQVHGASRTAWQHLKELTEIEINSVTDNPVIIENKQSISGGNFHGQPLALPLDYACLAASELGNISDRRIYLSLKGFANNVPKLLMKDTGTNSAFMMLQCTSAALASENKIMCFPASADSIPTSLGQEDHVSMGSIAGRKTLQVVGNLEKILAIELLCAAQALDFHKPLNSSPVIDQVHNFIREKISHASEDRIFGNDIVEALQIIQNKSIFSSIQSFKSILETPFNPIFEEF